MEKHVKTLLLGICAGIAIGLGGLLNIVANNLLANIKFLGPIVGSILFPIGLTLVCFCGFNLFTGKIGYLLDNKKDYWIFLLLVYIGNIIGSLIFGGLCILIFSKTNIYPTALKISNGKLFDLEFVPIMKVFAGSILCGALVYIAVFCYKSFNHKWLKVVGIFIPIALFVYLKFDHCIANMFYFAFSWSYGNGISYLNIAIVTLGNSLGAIFLNEGIKAFKKLTKKDE